MFEKFRLLLVNNFETIINLCLFLIIGSLLALLSTVTIEYRIVNLSKEIERQNLKANEALDWAVDQSTESNSNFIKNLNSKRIITLLKKDQYYDGKRISELLNPVENGPMTFALAYEDLIQNFKESIDINEIEDKAKKNRVLIDKIIETYEQAETYPDDAFTEEIIDEMRVHIRKESLFLSNLWFDIHKDSKTKVKILEASKNELVNFSSNIVFIIFSLQLLLYFVFQLYEVYSGRRKT